MTIHGGDLASIEWVDEPPSAQVKSAILLAALVAGVRASVREPIATRDHTERMLRALGVDVHASDDVVTIEPADRIEAFALDVPADPSSAAFLAGAGVLGVARAEVAIDGVLLNPTRVGFYSVLRRMGADVSLESHAADGAEPVGTIRTHRASLSAVQVGADEVPSMVDELPLLACIATRAEGETVIRGALELRVKESDRIRAVVSNLRALGADAEELEDGMIVRGGSRPLRGEVRTESDHRIAMAFGVLGALPGNDIRVDDPHCVDISYPGFWSDLAHVAG
jgi:3-phosphoshikimate 1-carboxyvinyltransferase